MSSFDPKTFWETRLAARYNAEGVGYIGLGTAYNGWMYRVRRRIFQPLLRRLLAGVDAPAALDIGSGTGFYIEMLQALGVTRITGLDLTETAVARLRERFPTATFLQCDIGAPETPLAVESYDLITAGEVLFHIVDDDRFAAALGHVARLLRPGGAFVYTDCFPHREDFRGESQVCRNLSTVESLLSARGLVVESRRPVFTLMSAPVDSDSRALRCFWKAQHALVARLHGLGAVLGALLYPLELLLARLQREGPSLEVMVCRKSEA